MFLFIIARHVTLVSPDLKQDRIQEYMYVVDGDHRDCDL